MSSTRRAIIRATPMLAELAILIPLALPLVLGQLCGFGVEVVSMVMAGHLGATEMGAVSVGASLWVIGFMAVNGLMMAVQPLVAERAGAGAQAETGAIFRQGLLVGVGAGVVIAAALIGLAHVLITVTSMPAAMRPLAQDFLRAAALSFPAFGLLGACRGFSEGLSRTRPTMICGAIGLLLEVPVGALLMFGGFGLKPLGTLGAGLALSFVVWVEALVYLGWIARSGRYPGTGLGGAAWIDRALFLRMLGVGLPVAGALVLEVTMFSVSSLAMAGFGAVAAAAHQVALTSVGVLFMVPIGISMAVTVRVAHHTGRRDAAAVRRAGLAGLGLVLAVQAAGLVTFFLAGRPIALLFTHDAHVVALAVVLLSFAAIFQLSDGTQVLANAALRGLPDTRLPMIIVLVAYWMVGLPSGLLLAYGLGWGPRGVWVGLILGLTTAATLLLARFLRATRFPRQRLSLPA